MVKDHSDGERGNPLPPHGLLFPIAAKIILYASSHRQDNTYHSCYTSRGALDGTRNSSMGPPSSTWEWGGQQNITNTKDISFLLLSMIKSITEEICRRVSAS